MSIFIRPRSLSLYERAELGDRDAREILRRRAEASRARQREREANKPPLPPGGISLDLSDPDSEPK